MIGIKDFGMPSCCVNCQMCDAYEKGMCVITDTECEDMYSQRNDDCPLVEIIESDDCVSREAVINTIMPYCSDDDGSTGSLDDLRNVLDDIESLPTVQPKRNKGEWI